MKTKYTWKENLSEAHNLALEEIEEFLTDDTNYNQLERLVDDGKFDSEEHLRDFVRELADHLGIEWEMTEEEAKEDYLLMQADHYRDMGIEL